MMANTGEEVQQRALMFLETLLNLMGIVAMPKISGESEEGIKVDIEGKELGLLIGKRGNTLLSIQYLTNIVANKGIEHGAKVILDVQGYRARREQNLRALAMRLAERVIKEGKDVVIEDLPPHERRIVHMVLKDHPQVWSHSEGEGKERKLIISLRRK